jgi:DNA-binding LacI/PurR family transcriptional regulator
MEDIKVRIGRGEYSADEPLPSQTELAKIYNTSEITSRRALTELANEGLVYRVRGKGTFISLQDTKELSNDKNLIKQIYLAHPSMPMEMFNHRFFSELIKGIQKVSTENGIKFNLLDIGDKGVLPEQEEHSGYILIPFDRMNPDLLYSWKSQMSRLVTVHYYYPQFQIPYVIVDNVTGGFLATQHLLSIGHRNIGIILRGKSFLELNQDYSLRLHGYRLALSQYEIPFDPSLVAIIGADSADMDSGYHGAKQLLSQKNPPSAIFATSDYKAIGAIQAVEEAGLRIPKDISIIGYDDIFVSPYVSPSLSTVKQNTFTVGQKAAEMLLFDGEKIKKGELLKEEVIPELIVRESTGPPEQR